MADSKNRKDKGAIIRLVDVWKTYVMGKVEVNALRGLSLDVGEGEFIAIQGPSGSGKSTAMNLVGCLDVPTRGSIYLDGKDISDMSESDLARIRGQKIGFVFQQFNLIPTLTALENVALPMIFQGAGPYERRERGRRLLELVELGDRLDHRPSELSGGQQQRVAIARSLTNDPEVILADEPTGALDSKTGVNVMNFLEKLHKEEGKTIVMVTHDNELASFAQRIVRLMDGKVIEGKKGD